MIGLILVTAAAIAQPVTVMVRVSRPGQSCVAAPALCLEREEVGEGYRLPATAQLLHDNKMDAYTLNPRPCGLIGNMRCPKKGRNIWQLGEPVHQTVKRSFGLR